MTKLVKTYCFNWVRIPRFISMGSPDPVTHVFDTNTCDPDDALYQLQLFNKQATANQQDLVIWGLYPVYHAEPGFWLGFWSLILCGVVSTLVLLGWVLS